MLITKKKQIILIVKSKYYDKARERKIIIMA